MTKAKSSSPYNPDKNRVAEIKRLKAKVGKQEGKSVATIQNGKPKAIPVYSLPRKFLRLNPANHRFRSSLNSLKKTCHPLMQLRRHQKIPFFLHNHSNLKNLPGQKQMSKKLSIV